KERPEGRSLHSDPDPETRIPRPESVGDGLPPPHHGATADKSGPSLSLLLLGVVNAMAWRPAAVLPEIQRDRELVGIRVHRERLGDLVRAGIRDLADQLILVPVGLPLDAGRIVLHFLVVG